ncbi:hypothetical protein [Nocardioides pacificus]
MTNSSSPSRDAQGHGRQPVADLTKAPLPTAATLRRRRSIPFQLTRFAVFNTRIMRMVLKGSH